MLAIRVLASSFIWLQLAFFGDGFQIQPRIINGIVSNPRDFPFFVSLVANGTDKFCGGTLISERWILTAAHCVEERRVLIAHLGLDAAGKSDQHFTINQSHQHIHPANNYMDHDVALIELPESIEPNSFVRPVNLANVCRQLHNGGEQVVVIGKGGTEPNVTNYSQIWDKRIRFAEFELMPTAKCMQETELDVQLAESASVICAHTKDGRSAFRGDSGGPLIRQRDGAFLGVASMVFYAEDPKDAPSHQIFAFVPYYLDWIAEKTGIKVPKCTGH